MQKPVPKLTTGRGPEGKRLTRLDRWGNVIDLFYHPPFVRNAPASVRDRCWKLRRVLYLPKEDKFIWVNDNGNLKWGMPVNLMLMKLGEKADDETVEFLKTWHRIRLVPHSYEGVTFFRPHGARKDSADLGRGTNLSGLVQTR